VGVACCGEEGWQSGPANSLAAMWERLKTLGWSQVPAGCPIDLDVADPGAAMSGATFERGR
jgi:hypothetical protein